MKSDHGAKIQVCPFATRSADGYPESGILMRAPPHPTRLQEIGFVVDQHDRGSFRRSNVRSSGIGLLPVNGLSTAPLCRIPIVPSVAASPIGDGGSLPGYQLTGLAVRGRRTG